MLASARSRLARLPQTRVVAVSSIYETDPWGTSDPGPYLNLAVELATDLAPPEFLDACLAIERSLGRERRVRWGPRTIDIDLILWDDLAIGADELTIPHPRFRDRAFVLVPLAEIAPEARDPVTGMTVRELLERCPDPGKVVPWRPR